jgi:hypothetical protein
MQLARKASPFISFPFLNRYSIQGVGFIVRRRQEQANDVINHFVPSHGLDRTRSDPDDTAAALHRKKAPIYPGMNHAVKSNGLYLHSGSPHIRRSKVQTSLYELQKRLCSFLLFKAIAGKRGKKSQSAKSKETPTGTKASSILVAVVRARNPDRRQSQAAGSSLALPSFFEPSILFFFLPPRHGTVRWDSLVQSF